MAGSAFLPGSHEDLALASRAHRQLLGMVAHTCNANTREAEAGADKRIGAS